MQRVSPQDWPDRVEDVSGPQLVLGGPGTGKTEFLARRAAHLLDTGTASSRGLLVLGFSRLGVADLSDRIRSRLDRAAAGFEVTTFHSLALRLLEVHAARRGWSRPPTVLAAPEQVHLVAELLADEDPTPWSPAFRPLLRTVTFAEEVTDFVLRCREGLIGPERVAAAGRADWRGLPGFLERYDAELRRRGRIDYGTLLTEAVALLDDDEVLATLPYRFVLVDEYQDTTIVQARLLRGLVRRHRNVTVAADPHQSVFGFRGADPGNVERFPEEFSDSDGRPARRLLLTASHRVPEVVLAAARRLVPDAHTLPSGPGGSVEAYRFDRRTEEAEWIAAEVERLHLELGLPYRAVAVFVRSTRRLLPELSRALQRRGIPHDRPDARLADHPAVRFVLDSVLAATGVAGPAESAAARRRLLLGATVGLPLGAVSEMERLHRAGTPWSDLLREAGLETLAELLGNASWARDLPASEGLWRLWSSLPQTEAVATDPRRAEERAAWASLSQVLARWNERDPDATLLDYLRLVEDEDFEAVPLLTPLDGDRVTLATLHQAKGLEFDVVFVADAVEGILPDLRIRDSLLGTRHLTSGLGDAAAVLAYRLAEERRLAYTATTRARRRVVWTCGGDPGDTGPAAPSRFLDLVREPDADPLGPPPPRTRPLTPAEVESTLRRRLADTAGRPSVRLAALATLAEGPRHGLRSVEAFFGVRRRGPARGVVPPDAGLSPSQAEAYAECPRRYVLERRLGVGAAPGLHAALGTLLHAVVELVERTAIARGDPHGTEGEALADLEHRFDPPRFGGEPYATAWRRRAERFLTNLYSRWPSTGRGVEVERHVDVELAGRRWRGVVDRLELRDGAHVVVDLKSAKQAMRREDAAGSLQLAFYVWALREEGIEVAAAELWYPLHETSRGFAVRRFDPARLDEAVDRLRAAGEGITTEAWDPTPGPRCDRCPVRRLCPAWPEGREAFAS